MGFRTAKQIDQERYALKALRGDFDRIQWAKDKLAVFHAVGVRRENLVADIRSTEREPPVSAGILFGLGLGGFFDEPFFTSCFKAPHGHERGSAQCC